MQKCNLKVLAIPGSDIAVVPPPVANVSPDGIFTVDFQLLAAKLRLRSTPFALSLLPTA